MGNRGATVSSGQANSLIIWGMVNMREGEDNCARQKPTRDIDISMLFDLPSHHVVPFTQLIMPLTMMAQQLILCLSYYYAT